MKHEKLDAWRGWISVRVCEECLNVIPRSKSRFHCRECETNLCTDCAKSRCVTPAESLHYEDSNFRTEHSQPEGSVRRNHDMDSNCECDAESDSPVPRLGNLLPSSALYPCHGHLGSLSSRVQASSTRQQESHDNMDDVSAPPPPPPSQTLHAHPGNVHVGATQNNFPSQSTSRRHTSGGIVFASPRAQSVDVTLRQLSSHSDVHAVSTPRTVVQRVSNLQRPAKSAFRQRRLKGTSTKVNFATAVEWIFLDENELVSELTRFSVPARGDMQRNRLRTPSQIHVSWCPYGASCAEHGGRNWCGHKGCPYSVYIPEPTPVIASQQLVPYDSFARPQIISSDSRIITSLVQSPRQASSSLGLAPIMNHAPLQCRQQFQLASPRVHDLFFIGAKVW